MSHARLSPSNTRWPYCAGSVREEAAYPDTSGAAAIDGTGSHLLLELCLENNCRAEDYDGHIIGVNHEDQPQGWLVNIERCKRVQLCLDYIQQRVTELRKIASNVEVYSERKLDVGGMFGRDDWKGTGDVTIVAKNSRGFVLFVEIIDYKDGRGWVSEIDNTQLLSYAGGVLRPYIASGPELVRPFHPERVDKVRMTIVQPKTSKPIRSQDTTAHYVLDKVIWLSDRARATDDPNAPLTPDDKGGKGYCTWCKHKPNCTAQSAKSLEVIKTMSNSIEVQDAGVFELITKSTTDIQTLSNEKLTQLMDIEAGVQAVFDKVKNEIQRRIDEGETVNGFAMVDGRCSKVWNLSEEELVKKFRAMKLTQDDIYPKKIASPAQILSCDKLTDKQKTRVEKEFITEKSSGKKLTRVAYNKKEKDVSSMFADVESAVQTQTSDIQSQTVSFL